MPLSYNKRDGPSVRVVTVGKERSGRAGQAQEGSLTPCAVCVSRSQCRVPAGLSLRWENRHSRPTTSAR